jgi:anti-sigma-K factor RskA
LWVWRGAAAAGALATVLAVVTGFSLRDQLDIRGKQVDELSAQLKVAPKIEYVAVLVDAKSAETMLVTFDSKSQNLVLQRAEKDAGAMQLARQSAQAKSGGSTSWLGSTWQGLWVWRGAAAAGALATVLAVVTGFSLRDQLDIRGKQVDELSAQLKVAPKIEYVAVLVDAKSAETMLVTFDSKSQNLVLQRVGDYQEASDKSLQLWALPNSGGPRSLGVLGGDKVLRLATAEDDVKQVPTLAISLEPKGGVPSAGGPTGPVLFKGALIQKVI